MIPSSHAIMRMQFERNNKNQSYIENLMEISRGKYRLIRMGSMSRPRVGLHSKMKVTLIYTYTYIYTCIYIYICMYIYIHTIYIPSYYKYTNYYIKRDTCGDTRLLDYCAAISGLAIAIASHKYRYDSIFEYNMQPNYSRLFGYLE